eukprot:3143587-Amphidinium_carterae.1
MEVCWAFLSVSRTSLEEELAARESCLRAGEAMHRHLEDACSKVSEAYQTELRAAATEHEIELGPTSRQDKPWKRKTLEYTF